MPKKTKDVLYNINILKKKDIAYIFDVQPRAVYVWTKEGCPRNIDESYNLRDVVQWRESKIKIPTSGDEKYEIEIQKLRNHNRKLELEIEEKEGKTISRERFIEIQQQQASSLMHYLTDGFKRNSQELYSKLKKAKSIQSFLEIFDGFIKQAMNKFTGSGLDI